MNKKLIFFVDKIIGQGEQVMTTGSLMARFASLKPQVLAGKYNGLSAKEIFPEVSKEYGLDMAYLYMLYHDTGSAGILIDKMQKIVEDLDKTFQSIKGVCDNYNGKDIDHFQAELLATIHEKKFPWGLKKFYFTKPDEKRPFINACVAKSALIAISAIQLGWSVEFDSTYVYKEPIVKNIKTEQEKIEAHLRVDIAKNGINIKIDPMKLSEEDIINVSGDLDALDITYFALANYGSQENLLPDAYKFADADVIDNAISKDRPVLIGLTVGTNDGDLSAYKSAKMLFGHVMQNLGETIYLNAPQSLNAAQKAKQFLSFAVDQDPQNIMSLINHAQYNFIVSQMAKDDDSKQIALEIVKQVEELLTSPRFDGDLKQSQQTIKKVLMNIAVNARKYIEQN